MSNGLHLLIAQEHIADLRRTADADRLARSTSQDVDRRLPSITVRSSRDEDGRALVDLAALDSARPLSGGVIVAFVDGELVAALDLDDGRVISSPMARTTQAIAVLRLRAEQLDGVSRPWPRRFGGRLRTA